jgi:hypothetical protein
MKVKSLGCGGSSLFSCLTFSYGSNFQFKTILKVSISIKKLPLQDKQRSLTVKYIAMLKI